MKIKICGIASAQATQAVIAARADYAGFVHFPASPRHVTLEKAAALAMQLPASIRPVMVLVDPDDALLRQVTFETVQLHGKESRERLLAIRKQFPRLKIIKAISVSSNDDIAAAKQFYDCVDMLMFDAKPPLLPLPSGEGRGEGGTAHSAAQSVASPSSGAARHLLPEGEGIYLPGGNGLAFDWTLLKSHEFPLPWFLSGGLNAENVAEAIRISGAKMVDVSSGVESAPGVKEAALIQAFVKAARNEK